MTSLRVQVLKKKPRKSIIYNAAAKSGNSSPPVTGQRGPAGTTQFGDQQPRNTPKDATKEENILWLSRNRGRGRGETGDRGHGGGGQRGKRGRGRAARGGYVKTDDIVQRMGDKGAEVIIDATKLVTESSCLLKALLDEGLGIVIEAAETTKGKTADGFQRYVQDGFDVGIQHVGYIVVELGDLGD
jgi:ribosomal protein L15